MLGQVLAEVLGQGRVREHTRLMHEAREATDGEDAPAWR